MTSVDALAPQGLYRFWHGPDGFLGDSSSTPGNQSSVSETNTDPVSVNTTPTSMEAVPSSNGTPATSAGTSKLIISVFMHLPSGISISIGPVKAIVYHPLSIPFLHSGLLGPGFRIKIQRRVLKVKFSRLFLVT